MNRTRSVDTVNRSRCIDVYLCALRFPPCLIAARVGQDDRQSGTVRRPDRPEPTPHRASPEHPKQWPDHSSGPESWNKYTKHVRNWTNTPE